MWSGASFEKHSASCRTTSKPKLLCKFPHPYPNFPILHPTGTPSFPPSVFETALRKRAQLWRQRRDLV
jgi:hypothetical protein